jgi:hypothetical protein
MRVGIPSIIAIKKKYASGIVINVVMKNEQNEIDDQRLNVSESEFEAFLVEKGLDVTYNIHYLSKILGPFSTTSSICFDMADLK